MDQEVQSRWLTKSGVPLQATYTSKDWYDKNGATAKPGAAPFLRGSYPLMYRTRPWRIFQLSGFGTPEDEAERIRFLLAHGETGFIMEHDRNTDDHLYDVDNPEVIARKEDVGMVGAATISVRDFETILRGIPLESVYAHPGGGVVQFAPFANACYWEVARRRGLDLSMLSGTGQSDFFLTYLGCLTKDQIPTGAGLRLNCDLIEFCLAKLRRWVPVSIAGYNGAESGLNATQELGAVLANAVEYLDGVLARGQHDAGEVAARVGGVSYRVSMEFFEDIAKLRAARRMWSTLLRERYGITDEKAARLRIHALTAGSSMTYQQPLNNIARGALMGLVAVLGGVQSLGVSGYDEAISIPSEHAHQTSIRIQQILQHEMGLLAVADPLGGSYFMEKLTDEIENEAWAFFEAIQERGGFMATLDSGWLLKIAETSGDGERGVVRDVVGVDLARDDVSPFVVSGFQGVNGCWEEAMSRLTELRATRHERGAADALRELKADCNSDRNIMPSMLAAVAADVTVGEIGSVFRDAFGVWDAPIPV